MKQKKTIRNTEEDAAQRLHLAEKINGELANMLTHQEKVSVAEVKLNAAQERLDVLQGEYASARDQLDKFEVGMTVDNVTKINGLLTEIETVTKERNDAKSLLGTATTNLKDHEKALRELRTQLLKLLPKPASETGTDDNDPFADNEDEDCRA